MRGNVLEVAEFLHASMLFEEGDDELLPSRNIDAMADIIQNIAAVGSGDLKVLKEIRIACFPVLYIASTYCLYEFYRFVMTLRNGIQTAKTQCCYFLTKKIFQR